MKHLSLAFIIMACFFKVSHGQDVLGPQLNAQRVEFLSPQTYEFVRYGNLPVSHFNGEADVKIPVYTYSDRDFELPMFLGYNSSGFMPSKREGIVGLNWYLNSGAGVITRMVNYRPDEKEGQPIQPSPELHGYYYGIKNSLITNKTKAELFDPANGNVINSAWWTTNNCELQPDDFTFTVPGHNGKFFIENNGNVKTSGNRPFKVDLTGFGIQTQAMQLNLPISTIVITTDDGYKYTFGGELKYLEVTYGIAANGDIGSTAAGYPVIDAWHLREIQAPNGRTVTYEYEPFTEGLNTGLPADPTHYLLNIYDIIYEVKFFEAQFLQDNGWTYSHKASGNSSEIKKIRSMTKTVYLKKISISNSTPDLAHTTIEFINVEKQKAFYRIEDVNDLQFSQKTLELKSILVKHNGTTIKQFDFGYQYYGGTHDRQFLTSFKETGAGSSGYNFYYHKVDPHLTGTPISLPNPRTHAIDHWGYWNAGADNQDILPDVKVDSSQNGDTWFESTERDPDISKSDIALLAKVSYPTSGYTEFIYEPHYYGRRLERRNDGSFLPKLFPVTGYAGGARIRTIKDNDGEKVVNEREFFYTNNYASGGTESSGILMHWPRYGVFWIYHTDSPVNTQHILRMKSASFNSNYYPGENFIHYGEVTEVIKPSNGFITYKFHDYITRSNREDKLTNPVLAATQANMTPSTLNSYNNFVGIKLNDRSFERGLPWKVTSYALKSGGGHYKVRETTTNFSTYEDYPNDYSVGVHETGGLAQSYKLYYYPVVPLSVTETIYSDEGTKSTFTTTDNTYNSAAYLLTKQVTLSDGSTQKAKFKYPLDFVTDPDASFFTVTGTPPAPSPTPLYQSLPNDVKAIVDLKLNNILSSPLEIINFRNGKAIGASYVENKDFGSIQFSKKVYPSKVWTVKTSEAIASFVEASILKEGSWSVVKNPAYGTDPEATFDHYDDKGNLLQTTDKSLLKRSYLWGYDKLYPIAEAVGISYDQFFYTGFEDAEGTSGIAKAGNKSRPGGFIKSLSGLVPGNYTLSYWQKQADDKWTPFTQEITVSTNPYELNISSTIHLDELRFYPKSPLTQLSTYTYDPLVGMTSKTDANNKMNYYEYDLSERLKLIRDFSKNIVKSYTYSFQVK